MNLYKLARNVNTTEALLSGNPKRQTASRYERPQGTSPRPLRRLALVMEVTVCRRCGREQPALHSPCPQCGRQARSTSSIPAVQTLNTGTEAERDPRRWGGDAEPSHLIRDPELRAAFMRAYRAYLRRRMQEAKT